MTNEVQISPTQIIETELQKFDVTIEALQELVAPVKDLKINGADDREGFIKVREARLMLKNKRVEIERNGKSLREFSVKFQKAVISRENELTGIIESEEQRLKGEETRYEQERERIRLEEERKEAQRVQNRIDALSKLGWAIDFYEAKIMPDEDFVKLYNTAEEEFNREQQRIAAEKAEAERIRKEEAEQMQREREELERQKAEQRKREQELAAERKELELQQLEKEAAIKAEQQRQRKEFEAQQAQLAKERDALEAEKRRIADEEEKKNAAERARLAEIERAKREEEERIEGERLAKLEAERQEALKPYKEKMNDFANDLLKSVLPEADDNASIKLNIEVFDFLSKLSDHIKSKIKSL